MQFVKQINAIAMTVTFVTAVQVYLQEVVIMRTQTPKFWREMPSEDRSFYKEFAATVVASLAIVLLA